MIHLKLDGTNNNVIFLLHGTGGNEQDLMPIAKYLDPHATLIGIRGNHEEGGMLRYFLRNADGSFDARSLMEETYILKNEIDTLIERYDLGAKNLYILGYSNGANIMQSMMKEFELPFKGYFLLHPAKTRFEEPFKPQEGYVMITSGANDPYINQATFQGIVDGLKAVVGDVNPYVHQHGHALTQEELDLAKKLYTTK